MTTTTTTTTMTTTVLMTMPTMAVPTTPTHDDDDEPVITILSPSLPVLEDANLSVAPITAPINAMTQAMAYRIVAEKVGLKHSNVKAVVEAMLAVAAQQLQSNGKFNVAGAFNMHLKLKKPSTTTARKGMKSTSNPASHIVRAFPTKKFMLRVEQASATVIDAD